jgi:hypothetical protein
MDKFPTLPALLDDEDRRCLVAGLLFLRDALLAPTASARNEARDHLSVYTLTRRARAYFTAFMELDTLGPDPEGVFVLALHIFDGAMLHECTPDDVRDGRVCVASCVPEWTDNPLYRPWYVSGLGRPPPPAPGASSVSDCIARAACLPRPDQDRLDLLLQLSESEACSALHSTGQRLLSVQTTEKHKLTKNTRARDVPGVFCWDPANCKNFLEHYEYPPEATLRSWGFLFAKIAYRTHSGDLFASAPDSA